jgi:hypothetical protein
MSDMYARTCATCEDACRAWERAGKALLSDLQPAGGNDDDTPQEAAPQC